MSTPVTKSGLVVLDASVWVSNISPRDTNRLAAENWINRHIADGGSFLAPMLLIVETAASIARLTQNPVAAREAVSELYSFSGLRLVPLDQSLVDEAADMAIRYRLRGGDSFYVALAHRFAIPLVTFDNEQLTRPTGIIATIRP